jgi:ABC-2 type transport system permease protein
MLVMPLFFLSGALYPLRAPSAWLAAVTRFDPITDAVYPVRHAVFSHLNISPAPNAALSPGAHGARVDGPRGPVARHRR